MVVLVSTGFSIYSTAKLANQIKIANENTYAVKVDIQTVRSRLLEMDLLLPTLLENDNTKQLEDIYELLKDRDILQEETIRHIRDHYLGYPKDIIDLEMAFEYVRDARLIAVDLFAEQSDKAEVAEYFANNVNPHSDTVLETLQEIEVGVDQRMELITKEARRTQIASDIVAVVFFALIVTMIAFTTYSEKKRNRTLKHAFLNEQKANSAKREFMSRMSHEIRTPINTIIGMNTIALRNISDAEYVTNCLNKVSFASKHSHTIINQ